MRETLSTSGSAPTHAPVRRVALVWDVACVGGVCSSVHRPSDTKDAPNPTHNADRVHTPRPSCTQAAPRLTKSLFCDVHHFPSASNFRKRSSPKKNHLTLAVALWQGPGLQKSYGQRCSQTSPCRNASLPKNGGVHSSVPCIGRERRTGDRIPNTAPGCGQTHLSTFAGYSNA